MSMLGASRPTPLLRVVRVLLQRMSWRVANHLSATTRAGRLRASRWMLVASVGITVYVWIAMRLLLPSGVADGALDLGRLAAAAMLANFLGFVLLLDAIHQALSESRQLSLRREEELYIIAGIDAKTRGTVAWLRLLGRAAVRCIFPVLALSGVGIRLSFLHAVALLTIAGSYVIVGDAVGRLLEGRSWPSFVAIWCGLAVWYLCIIAGLLHTFGGSIVHVSPLVRQIAAWPWLHLLNWGRWPWFASAIDVVSGVMALGMLVRWSNSRGWVRGINRGHRPQQVHAATAATVSASAKDRSTGARTAFAIIVARDLTRLSAWPRREPLAALLLLLLSLWPAALLLFRSGALIRAYSGATAAWTAMYCVAWVSLSVVELAWGSDNRREWASYRVYFGRLWLPTISRVAVLALVTAVFAISQTVPLLFHSRASPLAPAYLLDALLSGLCGVASGSALATVVLRLNLGESVLSRAARYSGVAGGLALPPTVLQATGSRWAAGVAAIALICAAGACCRLQSSRVQFVGER